MAKGKVVIIDGHSVVHRAWHALPPLSTSSGELVNAVFGFTSTLLKVLEEQKPDYVVVAFDSGKTFRHEQYEPYKATRDRTPEDLHAQFYRVEQVLQALSIPAVQVEGYEADDLLATLAERARREGMEVLIVSGDTDSFQLIQPGVRVLTQRGRFSDTVVYDREGIRERYGLDPIQLIDFKALVGDTSDNIPGVPGVGPKTASRLLAQHGSLEGIFEHLDEVGGKVAAALREHQEDVFLARNLIRLVREVPVDLDWELARAGRHDPEEVLRLFRQLEFKTLLDRLPPPEDGAQAADGPVADEEGLYETVSSAEGLEGLIQRLRQAPRLALDVETTSTNPHLCRLVGLSFAWKEGEAAYLPVGHGPGGLFEARSEEQLEEEQVLAALRPLLSDPSVEKVAHNAKFDMAVLARRGLRVHGVTFDTLLAAHLVDPSTMTSNSLKDLAFTRLGRRMKPIEELLSRGRGPQTMAEVELAQAARYAAADADVTLRLAGRLQAELREKDLEGLFQEVEMPLVEVLLEMELRGVKLDLDYLQQLSREFHQRMQALEAEIYELAGHPFNLNSPPQLAVVLFEELGLPATRRTKTGYSTAADVLEELRQVHPIVEGILNYRELAKLKGTYVDALPLLVHSQTGRVHPVFKQTGAVTGRIACEAPNIQNIPLRTEDGRRVRRAFVAGQDSVLVSADYSQVELRVLAHLCGDRALIEAFEQGQDIHLSTAARVKGVPLEEVAPEMRRLAKVVNFGIVYGLSEWGLAAQTELTQEEAAEFIRHYFQSYPGVREYVEKTKREARSRGWVATVLGRRRYFPELGSGSRAHLAARRAAERMAINMPVQGTAADIIKLAMLRVHRELGRRGLASGLIMQVHDELVVEGPQEEREEVMEVLRQEMEAAYPLIVPLKVDLHWGTNWADLLPA